MASATRTLAVVFVLVIASFVAHYVAFGSLPIGAPEMLDSNLDDAADARA